MLCGSVRNQVIPEIATQGRKIGFADETQLVADCLNMRLQSTGLGSDFIEIQIASALGVIPRIMKDIDGSAAKGTIAVVEAERTAVDGITKDTVKQRNAQGDLPIHLACENKAAAEVTLKMIELWPESAKERNKRGRLLCVSFLRRALARGGVGRHVRP